MKNIISSLIILICVLGCNSDEPVRGDKKSPGYAATMFFDAIYNKKDFDSAKMHSKSN